jgi:hypothetical protein
MTTIPSQEDAMNVMQNTPAAVMYDPKQSIQERIVHRQAWGISKRKRTRKSPFSMPRIIAICTNPIAAHVNPTIVLSGPIIDGDSMKIG